LAQHNANHNHAAGFQHIFTKSIHLFLSYKVAETGAKGCERGAFERELQAISSKQKTVIPLPESSAVSK